MTQAQTKAATQDYNAAQITSLEGLEAVRLRPGMYIGGVGNAGLHHLAWEVIDNAVDEAMNGHASEISVTLHADGRTLTVSDNGRGIPVDKHPKTKRPALEMILTELHTGGKFEGQNYKTSGGLHGVGASVVNALAASLVAQVKRDGAVYRMTFERGKPTSKLLKKKSSTPIRGTGTSITFAADPKIFPKVDFDPATLATRLEVTSYLHRGVRIVFLDETADKPQRVTYLHEEGLVDYLAAIGRQRKAAPIHDAPFTLEREPEDGGDGLRLELAMRWTESTDEHVRSYVNGIPTLDGGTHAAGFRTAVQKAVRGYMDTHKLTPRGVKVQPEDVREGLIGVVSVFIPEPQFQGQTKDKLNNPEVSAAVDQAVRPSLERWLNENGSVADKVVARVIIAARARAASRAAAQAITRKTATSSNRLTLPGKLADCTGGGRGQTELFIVEGDSAGGSAKQGRDRVHQAILPLRGKVLNTESTGLDKVVNNRELSDLITALGCGVGKNFDPSKLRYDRVVLLADADSDGHHITTLLLTFFYRHLPRLIHDGRVFIAMPPLYRIDAGKQTFWADDDAHKERILSEQIDGRAKPEIQRFKGLGEMSASVLWETTLDPGTRRLLKVDIADHVETDQVMNDLMGKDAGARFRFIMEHAEEAEALDV